MGVEARRYRDGKIKDDRQRAARLGSRRPLRVSLAPLFLLTRIVRESAPPHSSASRGPDPITSALFGHLRYDDGTDRQIRTYRPTPSAFYSIVSIDVSSFVCTSVNRVYNLSTTFSLSFVCPNSIKIIFVIFQSVISYLFSYKTNKSIVKSV